MSNENENRRSQRMMGDMHTNGMSPVSGDTMAGSVRDPWVNPVATLAEEMEETVSFYNSFLGEVGIDAQIDEVAVMFNRREEMWGWLMGAVSEPNVRIFNHARDSVNTSPIKSRYDVEYTFLESSSLPWRIEAMLLTGGHSPLHAAIAADRVGGAHIVHASFKVDSPFAWREAVDVLNDEGDCAQRCASDYGRFGYWMLDEKSMPRSVAWKQVFLKPRLNERDSR